MSSLTASGAGTAGSSLPPGDKASVLVESLPYIRRFWGKVVVVKYGGNVLTAKPGEDEVDEASALASFAEDIVLMRSVGMLPVVVHGGGPQIGALMARVGKEVEFLDGLRVTDADTIDLVRMVLVGKVNRDIVSTINVHGALAVGLSGEDANLITAAARSEALGYVGDVVHVDPVIVHQLLAQGLIPVVATIGTDQSGQAFNINADTAAGALASALEAEKLVFLTDVSGLRSVPDDPSTLIHQATVDDLDRLVASGAATGGMVPKVEACARAVRSGVGHAHILDGRTPHALLLEVFTDEGVGTMVGRRYPADRRRRVRARKPVDRSALMHNYAEPPVTFVRGEGTVLYDLADKPYLDFLSGLAVTSLGHAHPAVAEAIAEQAGTLTHVSNLFGNTVGPEVAVTLDRLIGGGTERAGGQVFFGNSGAEANECALKLARRWAGPGRFAVVSTWEAFHGRTLATLAATGQPEKQQAFPDARRLRPRALRRPRCHGRRLRPVPGGGRHGGAHPR